MKKIKFIAIFAAFSFVSYQMYNLNTEVKNESALSSLIETYSVVSEDRLSLRKAPNRKSSIIMKLDGKKSGKPNVVTVLSKENGEWWHVQYTDKDENKIRGYVASEYLELLESIETSSLFWNETKKTFEEGADSSICEKTEVSFTKSRLAAFDLGDLMYRDVEIKGEGKAKGEAKTKKQRLFSGALLKETSADGEFQILTNPITTENKKVTVASPGSVVILKKAESSSVKGKGIHIPDLSSHIEDKSTIAQTFKVESRGDKFVEYNCCLEGKACESFVKLKPEDGLLKEELMLPYKKQSVFSKLIVNLSEKNVVKDGELEGSKGGGDKKTISKTPSKSRKYKDFQKYFLGPKSPRRRGQTVYRLNIKSGGGSVKRGPCGSYHYNPENFGGLVGGDRYIKKEVLGCFLATLQEFKRKHPRERVQWGDISRGDRKSFKPDHSSHQGGRDIDVRPIRSDKKLLPCRLNKKGNARCYSRKMTKAFIDIALKYGGKPVYFNDRNVNRTSSKIQSMAGHYDHFHIRYSRSCTGVTLDTKYCPTEGFK